MAVDFSISGYESLFKKALRDGINIFCGAGFSVEAEDGNEKKLPTGIGLLRELQEEFPAIEKYTKLPRACTKLIQTDKTAFYSYLEKRFSVRKFSEKYLSLLNVNIRNIYTTNIDDLFFEIYKKSDKTFYLNDKSSNGEVFDDEYAINYYPLHGCVRGNREYVFGATEIACAFLKSDLRKSWSCLATDASHHPILFWGWNFEDTGPIEAMYGNNNQIEENINKWVLLYEKDDEMIDYLRTMNFNIIIGGTEELLEYIGQAAGEIFQKEEILPDRLSEEDNKFLSRYLPPVNDENLPSFPLNAFFLDYVPRWSHIYSGEIPRLSHYTQIADHVAAGRDVIMTGIRGSGKTTLLMQLMAGLETSLPKHYMAAPAGSQAEVYLKALKGHKSMLFVDDCFRDTVAVTKVLNAPNVQCILCDRDFNYERQYHKIKDCRFASVDITEISPEDAQKIKNIIPNELKRNGSTKRFAKDPTLLNLLSLNLKSDNFNFINDFIANDGEVARVFIMICYVHACGVPCSFDMVYSFLGDENYTWEQMYSLLNRVGGLIKECSEYFGAFDILNSLQDYYQCRSRFFAENIISSVSVGNKVFAGVLNDFIDNVPIYKICQYDKFKRTGYDADFTVKAFESIEDGERYYDACAVQDGSEYVYQQAAIYFSRKNDYKRAFRWIDRARNMAYYNRFSIDSTYAQLYFDVNLQSDRTQTEKALDIMENCCQNDKRKSIHFSGFAERAIKFFERYQDAEAYKYISDASGFIKEGLNNAELAVSKKNKWKLKDLQEKLEHLHL